MARNRANKRRRRRARAAARKAAALAFAAAEARTRRYLVCEWCGRTSCACIEVLATTGVHMRPYRIADVDPTVVRAFWTEVTEKAALARGSRREGRVWNDAWTRGATQVSGPGRTGFGPRAPLCGADVWARRGWVLIIE